MIVNNYNSRFMRKMYSDSRLIDQQVFYCLCTRCKKTKVYETDTQDCKRHDDFVKMTGELNLVAPVFACFDFEERTDVNDYMGRAIEGEETRSLREIIDYVGNK